MSAVIWTERAVNELRDTVQQMPDTRNRQLRGKGELAGDPYSNANPTESEAGSKVWYVRNSVEVAAGATVDLPEYNADDTPVSGSTITGITNGTGQPIAPNSFLLAFEVSGGRLMLPYKLDECIL